MKKFLILLIAAVILFSGCAGQQTVKQGNNISVDYTGSLQDGKVFDTSIESVAKENDIIKSEYKPLKFTVGKKQVIEGFDEGVVGMKVGESKKLTISPEKGYGPINPERIQVIPIITDVPATTTFPKVFEIPDDQFERTFGTGNKIGDIVQIPDTNINVTIQNISSNVTLSYNLKVGENISSAGAPWNQTVIKIDDKNITLKPDVKKNDIVQFYPGAPWNTTVLDATNESITLKHNAVPDTTIPTMFGQIRVSFNETFIIVDRNHELAGKTLIFNVTVRLIEK